MGKPQRNRFYRPEALVQFVPVAILILAAICPVWADINLSPSNQNFQADGGQQQVQVINSPPTVSWTVSSSAAWVTISSGASGSGNGSFVYTVAGNPTATDRQATITVTPASGQVRTHQVSQKRGELNISPSSANVGASGGTGTVTVNMQQSPILQWSAVSSDPSWLIITAGNTGIGVGAVEWRVDPNPTAAQRQATITVTPLQGTGQVFTVNQQAGNPSPTISVSPSSASVPTAGASGSLQITATPGSLSWTAASTPASWLRITSGANGTGNGSVSYIADPNPAATSRSGSITISGTQASPVTVVINQPAASISISPSDANVGEAGGTGNFNITANSPALGWAITGMPQWVTVSPAFGTGSASVTWTVAVNAANSARSATILITPSGGPASAFQLNQQAASPGVISLNPGSRNGPASAFTGSFQVTASAPSLTWTLASDQSWLTVLSPANSAGSATVQFSAAGNPSGQSRTARITVTPATGSPQIFTLDQAGGTLTLNPSAASPAATGGTGQFTLTTDTPTLRWSAESSADWLTITSIALVPFGVQSGMQSGSAQIRWAAAANTGTASRTARVTITPENGGSTQFTVTQPFLTGTLSAEPGSIAFSYQLNGDSPADVQLTIRGEGGSFPISVNTSTVPANWLTAIGGGTTPAVLNIAVDPGGLAAGTYRGSITVSSPAATNSPITIPVTLTITPAPVLTANPNALAFAYQSGGNLPAARIVQIGSSFGNLPFTVTPDQSATWLRSGSTDIAPASLSVSVDPANLQPGTYNGNVIIEAPGAGNSPLRIPVSLQVSSAPNMTATPPSLSVSYRQLDPPPSPVSIAIGSTGGPLSFTAESLASWLTVPASGQTSTSFQATVNPSGLQPGFYQSAVIIRSPGAANNPLTITLALTVQAAPQLTAAPAQANFATVVGGSSLPAQIAISSTVPVSFTAQASSTGNWLVVHSTGSQTPATLTISAASAGLAEGVYSGAISLTSPAAGNSPLNIPVILTVSPRPRLSVSPAAIGFNYRIASGMLPPPGSLVVAAPGDAHVPLTLTVSSDAASWLSIQGTSTTPAILSPTADPSALAVGSYSGTVTVESPGYLPAVVPVSLQVTAAPLVTVQPSSITFTYQEGGAAPAGQSISVRSSSVLPFSVSRDPASPWLLVSGGGQTDGSASIAVNPAGLQPGVYSGFITVAAPQAGNNNTVIPVTLTVAAHPVLTAVPASLSFTYTQRGAIPPPLAVGLDSSQPLSFTTSELHPASWLSVSAPSVTPASLQVSVNPAGLEAGEYNSIILISAPGAANSPVSIPVFLRVLPAPSISSSISELNFSYQISGTLPAARQLVVTATNPDIVVTASASTDTGGSWLQVTGGGQVPSAFNITVDTSGLPPGIYSGAIALVPAGGLASQLTIPVTLVVSAAPVLTASPGQLSLTYRVGDAAPSLIPVSIASSSGVLSFQVSSSTETGGAWLRVSSGSQTPATLTPEIVVANLVPGLYQGSIAISSSAAANSPLVIPVSLVVTTDLALSAVPSSLQFTGQQNGPAPSQQVIRVTSSSTAIPVAYSVAEGSPWLSVGGPPSTPGEVIVSVATAGLAPGRYSALILGKSELAANNPLTIPVTLDIYATPVLAAAPTVLQFSYEMATPKPEPRYVIVSSGGSPLDFDAAIVQGAAWLFVSGGGQTPSTLRIDVDPGSLSPGEYSGAVLLTPRGGGVPRQIAVSLSIAANSVPRVTPAQLVFGYRIGGDFPPSQTVVVSSDGRPIVVFASEMARTANWVSIGGAGVTPTPFTVSVNPAGLSPGTYTSQFLFQSPDTPNSINLPVRLTVTAAPVLSAVPTTLAFEGLANGAAPTAKVITVDTLNGAPAGISVQPASGVRWLSASLNRNTTPASVTVSAVTANLPVGTYTGSILISSAEAGNSPLVVPVTLTISGNPLLQPSLSSLSFAATAGGPSPAPSTIGFVSTGVPLEFTAAVSPGASWLTVSGGGPTPARLTVTANTSGLPPGNYQASIIINSPAAGTPTQLITVSLRVVADAPLLSVAPNAISFVDIGPRQQTVQITSSVQSVSFLAEASSATPWLSAQAVSQTPGSIQVAVNPAGLPPGTYSGAVQVTAPGVANSPISVPVNLVVTQAPSLQATPAPLSFVYDSDQPFPSPRDISVTLNSLPASGAIAAVAPGTPWLSVKNTANGRFTVTASPSGLLKGSYSGSVLINSPGASNNPLVVPVNFDIIRTPVADFSRRSVVLLVPEKGAPATTTVTIAAAGAENLEVQLNLTASTWMSISPLSGKLPLTVTVTADPSGLRPGSYAGSLIVNSSGKEVSTVPLFLTVAEQPGLAIAAAHLDFKYSTGGGLPDPLDIQAIRFGDQFLLSAVANRPWITIDPATPTAAGPLQVSVNPQGLGAGTHKGEILATLTDRPGGPPLQTKIIPVEFYIDQPASPRLVSVSNGASFFPSPLSPGLIFSVFGAGIGPATGVSALTRTETTGLEPTAYTTLTTTLGDAQVLVNGIACPLIYASATQINAIAPYALHTKNTAKVEVRYRGVVSNPMQVTVSPSSAGLFGVGMNGIGPGAILNQNGSVNTAVNPAEKGTIISLFATGEGQTNPHGIDGRIAGEGILPTPLQPVSVFIGGIPATEITYAGGAPTLTAGAFQVNVRVPAGVASGNIPVTLKVGDAISQPGLNVNVR